MRYGRILLDNKQATPEGNTVNMRVDPVDYGIYIKLPNGTEFNAGFLTERAEEGSESTQQKLSSVIIQGSGTDVPLPSEGQVQFRYDTTIIMGDEGDVSEITEVYMRLPDKEIPLNGFDGNRRITRVGLPADIPGGDTLPKVFNNLLYPASSPVIGLSIPNNVREKGTSFAPVISGNFNPKDAIVVQRRLLKNGVLLNQPNANDFSYTDIAINTLTTYTYEVDYTLEGNPNTARITRQVFFYAPSYYGSSAPGASQATIKAFGKQIWDKQTRSVPYNANNQVYYFVEPAAYNGLSVIKDQNGFVVTTGYTVRYQDFTLADGTLENMRIYEKNDLTDSAGFIINHLR